MKQEPSYGGLSRPAIRRGIDESLARLGTDYLDIYYLYLPDYETPIEETFEPLEELRQEGKIRYTATSNYSAWQLCEIFWLCEKNGYQPPRISQPMYNILTRGIEQEYLAFTKRFEVGVVAYNPLAGGLLTGKHSLEQGPIEGTRFDGNRIYQDRFWHQGYFDSVEELKAIAEADGRSLIELAFAWVFAQESIDAVILGASNADQLESNLRALEGPPPAASTVEQCDEVWARLRGPTAIYNR